MAQPFPTDTITTGRSFPGQNPVSHTDSWFDLLDKKDFLASFRKMAVPELDPGAHWACLPCYSPDSFNCFPGNLMRIPLCNGSATG